MRAFQTCSNARKKCTEMEVLSARSFSIFASRMRLLSRRDASCFCNELCVARASATSEDDAKAAAGTAGAGFVAISVALDANALASPRPGRLPSDGGAMLTAAATRRVFCLAKCVKVVVLELLLSYDCILITHCVPPQVFVPKNFGAITTLGCRWLRGRGRA